MGQAFAEGRGFFGFGRKKKSQDVLKRQHISGEYLDPTPADQSFGSIPRALPADSVGQEYFYPSDSVPSISGTVPGSTWSAEHEAEFSKWVQEIGESGCNTPSTCLNSSANSLRKPGEDFSVYATIDCGRLPYLLRGYFAMKKNLPMTITKSIRPLGPLGNMPNPERYTGAGNAVTSRSWLLPGAEDSKAKADLIRAIAPASTMVLRIPSNLDDNDFYPIKVEGKNITPGTIYYDPMGHAAIVYKVDDRGVIHTLNAHPGGSSFSHKVFNPENFKWSAAVQNGGGFKKFRPIVEKNNELHLASNASIPDFSLDQYSYSGDAYYDYIANSTSDASDPLYVFHLNIKELCENFGNRVEAVERARVAGLPSKPLDRLPTNIYGASGEWEDHSTPSADLRIKSNLARTSQKAKEEIAANPSLKKEMQKIFIKFEYWEGCRFSYTNSVGQKVNLGLQDIFMRAYDISFDPYQCPELRMGAPQGSAELSTCNSGPDKMRWYNAQSTLRNRLDKDVNLNTGFDVAELESRKQSIGPAKGNPVDLLSTLF